jgi:hypothetical protein
VPTTILVKRQKTAMELAEMIRRLLGKSELRVAVFATTRGWKARVYPEPSDNAAQLQALVAEKAAALGEQYELIQ